MHCSLLSTPTIRSAVTGLRAEEGRDFLPVIKLLCLTKHRRLLSWGAPSRPVERSTVLPLPRTLRAGLCQGRCAASRTALARGALPKVGRDEGMSVPVELRDRCDLRRCRRTMVGVE